MRDALQDREEKLGSGVGPMVSVVIPFYNHERYVFETLTSVMDQDYGNFEVLVGEDASRDGTADKLREFAAIHPKADRIRFNFHAENLGIAENVNHLLHQCQGEYIAFLGGDDRMKPGRIRKQAQYLSGHPRVSLCYTNAEVFDSDRGTILSLHNEPGINPPMQGDGRQIILGNVICSTTAMVRRNAMPDSGFNPDVKLANDWLFFIEVALNGELGYIDEVLSEYRRHSGNVSRTTDLQLQEEFQIMDILERKYPEIRSTLREGRANIFARMAREHEFAGNFSEAARMMRRFLASGGKKRIYTLLYAIEPRLVLGIRHLKAMLHGRRHWSRPS